MAAINPARVTEFLVQGARATTTKEKGDAFEELICYLFSTIIGITVTRRNQRNVFSTEEIDVAFFNEQTPLGLPFLPWIILVECKNWSSPVGSEHVAWFDTKLRNRGVSFGVLFAANGITGEATSLTAAHHTISSALSEGRQLIVLRAEEIVHMTDSGQLVLLIKEKLCDLVVSGAAL